jgi:regulator of sigma E protease
MGKKRGKGMHMQLLAAVTWSGIVEYVKGIPFISYLWDAWFLLLVLIGFSVIVFVHELGHFVLAKLVGIRVETFAIGFGPRLFGLVRGGTDYCLRLLPLGGYVKMMGQEDFTLDHDRLDATKVDPGSFLAKTPGQRALVVSGGVIMNVLFAAVAFIIVFMRGMEFPAPVAGAVIPGSPAAAAGIKPGDIFLNVDGEKIYHFGGLQLAILTSDPTKGINLTIDRDGKIIHTRVKPLENKKEELLQIGLARPATLTVWEPGAMPMPGSRKLQEGDEIVKVDSITPRTFEDVEETLSKAAGKPIELTVRRKIGPGDNAPTVPVKVMKRAYIILLDEEPKTRPAESMPTPHVLSEIQQDTVSILGLVPRRKFVATPDLPDNTSNPADFAQAGDVVLRVANIMNPTWREIKDFFYAHRRSTVELEVIRGEGAPQVRKQVKLYVPWRDTPFGLLMGQLGFDDTNTVVSKVIKGKPAAALNLPGGARILSCAGKSVASWFDIIRCFDSHAGKTVDITYEYGPKTYTGRMTVPADKNWESTVTYAIDFFGKPMTTIVKAKYPHQAFVLGLKQTWYIIKSVYVTIQRVAFTRTIGFKQLSGPIYIIHQGKEVAEAGFYKLLYYMALISANLAVINFLPLPVVDGGLIIILILEKVRGRSLSPRSTAIWQAVGFSLIIALFVFVTYNDILKIIRGQ